MINYEDMPLRGKISPTAWENTNGMRDYGESTRRYCRKHHKYLNPYKGWNEKPLYYKWQFLGIEPSKGKKPKTWKDYATVV